MSVFKVLLGDGFICSLKYTLTSILFRYSSGFLLVEFCELKSICRLMCTKHLIVILAFFHDDAWFKIPS